MTAPLGAARHAAPEREGCARASTSPHGFLARAKAYYAAVLLSTAMLSAIATPACASCAVSTSDWSKYVSRLGDRNAPVAEFGAPDSGDCGLVPANETMRSKYGNCQTSVSTILSTIGVLSDSSQCTSYLSGLLYEGEGFNDDGEQHIRTSTIKDMCSTTFADLINSYFCDPVTYAACPRELDTAEFSPFVGCMHDYVKDMTPQEQIDFYNDKKDVACIRKFQICPYWQRWVGCPALIRDVMWKESEWNCTLVWLETPSPLDYTVRCNWTFEDANSYYCYDAPSDYSTIAMAVGVSFGVAFIPLILYVRHRCRPHHISDKELLSSSMMSISAFNRGEDGSMTTPGMTIATGGGSSSSPGNSFTKSVYLHPEAGVVAERVAAKSKYRGVNFDANTNKWLINGAMGGSYESEMDAAKAAYLVHARLQRSQLVDNAASGRTYVSGAVTNETSFPLPGDSPFGNNAGYHPSPSSPSMVPNQYYSPPYYPAYQQQSSPMVYQAPYPSNMVTTMNAMPPNFNDEEAVSQVEDRLTDAQRMELRKQELIAFYEYWDPDKPNIKEHVDTLFERHDLAHIARAVKTKYGLLPPGVWSELG